MDKKQIIAFIEGQLAMGRITKEDLAGLIQGAQSPVPSAGINMVSTGDASSKNLTHILYGIGAIIIVLGAGILVSQNWDTIGFTEKILVTLGISIVMYVAGLILVKPEQKVLSQVLFTISAVLAPLGSYVLLDEAGIDFSWGSQLATATLWFVAFGAALLKTRRNILVIITIGFASWAYYTFIIEAFGLDYYDLYKNVLKWASMVLGASYLLIGYGYSLWQSANQEDKKERGAVQGILYGLGTFVVLGAGITVGGFFDLFFIALIFGAFYGSVYLKSRYMLILGAGYLMAHIFKLTSEYFADSIGWPVALMIVGFLVIGVAYVTFYLNREFISEK